MRIKSLLLGSVVALAFMGNARAADLTLPLLPDLSGGVSTLPGDVTTLPDLPDLGGIICTLPIINILCPDDSGGGVGGGGVGGGGVGGGGVVGG